MSIGTFCLVRNESPWIAAHILRVLPYVDEMVLFDGNSTDGTTEIIRSIQKEHKHGKKLRLFEGLDPKNLQDDYVRLFNDCLHELSTDLAFFLHPDMYPVNPERISQIANSEAIALSVRVRSFAGEPGGQLYEVRGRGETWKSIYRLKNPDLGAHYWGHYGHEHEDVYFKAITGNTHIHHGEAFHRYPYFVEPSGIEVLHFSDVRTKERRYDRMVKCLINNGWPEEKAIARTLSHPRYALKNGEGLKFVSSEYPPEFLAARAKYQNLMKEQSLV